MCGQRGLLAASVGWAPEGQQGRFRLRDLGSLAEPLSLVREMHIIVDLLTGLPPPPLVQEGLA